MTAKRIYIYLRVTILLFPMLSTSAKNSLLRVSNSPYATFLVIPGGAAPMAIGANTFGVRTRDPEIKNVDSCSSSQIFH